MSKWMLTDEEIINISGEAFWLAACRRVAIAEAKKLVKWLETKGKPVYGDNLVIFEMTYEDLRSLKQSAGINEIV